MKLKKIFIFLLVFCSVFMISIPVNAEEPTETYPCYCEKCVSAFNTKYSTYPYSSSYNLTLSGSNESLNGYNLFVYFDKSDNLYTFVFANPYELDSTHFRAERFYFIDSNTPSLDLNSKLNYVSYANSYYFRDYTWLYCSLNPSSTYVYTYFEWPSHPISEAEKFSNNFPSFITSCWNSLTGFIGDNKLVLFIFIIPVAFAVIGLIKRGFR